MLEQQRNRSNNRVYEYAGKSMTLSEWADELSIGYGTLYRRLTVYGWPPERAFEVPAKGVYRFLTFRGETRTLRAWSRQIGITANNLAQRIDRYGWSIAEALTTPVKAKRHS